MTDQADLRRRLEFIRIDQHTQRALKSIKPKILDAIPEALEMFYKHIGTFEETRKFFSDDRQIERAAGMQNAHWKKLIDGNFDASYIQSVKTIGAVHAKIGLEPRWYIGGYAIILSHMANLLTKTGRTGIISGLMNSRHQNLENEIGEGIAALTKCMMLDMDFVISTYFEMAEEARRKTEADAIRLEQELVVNSIGNGLHQLMQGDLTFRLNQALPPAYEKVRSDFNSALDKMELLIRSVITAGEAILSASGELSTAADDLSRRTEQQAASLEETAAALDEITASIREAAVGADTTQRTAETARQQAADGGDIVARGIGAMEQIAESSREISEIVGVIDEMAFQTNLLSLNAGVEAARAGESGRGFAVVASEVRTLAQRSAEAAKKIKGLIGRASVEVELGVGLVNETGAALTKIVKNAEQIDIAVANVAAGSKEQAAALAEVNTAMGQMDQLTQQNAAMVEQTTAATHAVADEAAELMRLISEFRVSGAKAPQQLKRNLRVVQ